MSAQEATESPRQRQQAAEQHPVTEVLLSHWAQMYAECRSQYHDATFLNIQLERRCESLHRQMVEIHAELGLAHQELNGADTMNIALSHLVLKMLRENQELVERYRDDYYQAIRGTEIIDLTADEEMEDHQ